MWSAKVCAITLRPRRQCFLSSWVPILQYLSSLISYWRKLSRLWAILHWCHVSHHKTDRGACFHLENKLGTHSVSVRGWLTHFLNILLPKWVRVWSSTHSRLPFTPPSVCQQKSTNHKDLQLIGWNLTTLDRQSHLASNIQSRIN